uniref:Regulation of nuclear pre-mRNA domain containing 1B n=1 Tax=Laticauda laticaudata TaxID=8630 RepID=A0A8C5SWK0_LATLA
MLFSKRYFICIMFCENPNKIFTPPKKKIKTSKVPSSPRTLGHPFPLAPPFSVPAFYALPFPPPSREADEGCKKPLERLLNIWQERSVYGGEFIQQLKLSMEDSNKEKKSLKRTFQQMQEEEDDDYPGSYSPQDANAEDLIKALQDLENAASGDATVRQKIASLPQEVQDVSLLEKITDKEAAERLSKTVDEACLLLAEYNGRLAAELEDRRQLARMLIEYTQTQKDVLTEKEKKHSAWLILLFPRSATSRPGAVDSPSEG